MIKNIEIINYKGLKNLKLIFKEFNIIHGVNNIGKTRILEFINDFILALFYQNIDKNLTLHGIVQFANSKIEIIINEGKIVKLRKNKIQKQKLHLNFIRVTDNDIVPINQSFNEEELLKWLKIYDPNITEFGIKNKKLSVKFKHTDYFEHANLAIRTLVKIYITIYNIENFNEIWDIKSILLMDDFSGLFHPLLFETIINAITDCNAQIIFASNDSHLLSTFIINNFIFLDFDEYGNTIKLKNVTSGINASLANYENILRRDKLLKTQFYDSDFMIEI